MQWHPLFAHLLSLLGRRRWDRWPTWFLLGWIDWHKVIENVDVKPLIQAIDPEQALQIWGVDRVIELIGLERIIEVAGLERIIKVAGLKRILAEAARFMTPEEREEFRRLLDIKEDPGKG